MGSVLLLLTDRELIDLKWLNFLENSGVPFAIRVKAGLLVSTQEGCSLSLRSLLTEGRGARQVRATFPSQGTFPTVSLIFAANSIKGSELLIVASNVLGQNTLNGHRQVDGDVASL